MNDQLAVLFAKRFIQRRDVKAVQFTNGAYIPDRALKQIGSHAPLGFTMDHLHAHLEGRSTYGHYIVDQNDEARCFVIDIDLIKGTDKNPLPGFYCTMPTDGSEPQAIPIDPRAVWADRNPATAIPEARQWLKTQMSTLGRRMVRIIQENLGLQCAVAYSGAKGIHVYGFIPENGNRNAGKVRDGAILVLDIMDEWDLIKGEHFFGHRVEDPFLGYRNFTIEAFPKQATLDDKDLGNLVRLPLGRNLKSQDPTFFLDLHTPIGEFSPHPDPVLLLDSGDPYAIRG